MTPRIGFAALILATFIQSLPAASAEPAPCSLGQVVSVPVETDSQGVISVPGYVNGRPVSMLVDTGSYISSLGFDTAAALGLRLKPGAFGSYVNNVPVFFYAQTETFNLGPASGNGLQFFVVPAQLLEPGISGMIGPDIMKQFDVEIDFVGGNFKFFVPNTCAAPPVYWTQAPYAEVPMKVDRDWKVVVSAQLDGRPVTVILDTGASRSLMNFKAAKDLFGWQDDDPNLKSLTLNINGKPAHVYRYRFSTLTFEGIQVAYPDIDMAEGENFDTHGRGDAQLILGMSVLRQLHLYIGYKAQKLYLTAAEAK
jgi:predicted aspartyl protease